ncbi:MAG: toxic anion resistance protein [Eggerthellaceae bacterium]|nr:toxic anion resistance protein [Eggerthellaceae bacterium]
MAEDVKLTTGNEVTPEIPVVADVVEAVAEVVAPKAPEIVLELTPTALAPSELLEPSPLEKAPVEVKYLEDNNLSPEELAMVKEFAQKIDITDSNIVLQYGASAQKKIAAFSDNALAGVKTKDLGEVGDMIANLVTELKGFNTEDEKKGFLGLFKKKAASLETLKARYDSTESNVDRIANALVDHQNVLTKDIVMLDKMYDSNLTYFKELTMYIMAGKQKIEQEKNTTLQELRAKAEASGLAEDAQAANDFDQQIDRFEKKILDLELTRAISIQMAPQIRMIQNSDILMVDRIQSTIMNTIPLWKNQMVLALGMAHSQEAMSAQRAVNDLTNDLLKKNAETLQQGTIAVAQESERAIIDIETVKETNERLIATMEEVIRIQQEGRIARASAENEMARIEAELKQKLLTIRQ